MPVAQSRRRFLTNMAFTGAAGLSALGAAGLSGGEKSVAAEPPPETTTIRIEKDPVTCLAPLVLQGRAVGVTLAGSAGDRPLRCRRGSGGNSGRCSLRLVQQADSAVTRRRRPHRGQG